MRSILFSLLLSGSLLKITAAPGVGPETLNTQRLKQLPNNAAWRSDLQLDSPLNVKWGGAKGDTNTDDTASIQLALDSVKNGGEVFFPPGVYKITSQLLLIGTNVTLRGEGATLKSGWANLTMSPLLAYGGKNIVLDKLVFDGSGKNDELISPIGIAGKETGPYTIQRSEFFGTYAPVRQHAAISVGAWAGDINGITITDCWIHDNTNETGISISSGAGFFTKNVRISGNRFRNNTGKDLACDQMTVAPVIEGNKFMDNNGAIHMEGVLGGFTIRDNIITNTTLSPQTSATLGVPGTPILVFFTEGGGTITGNHIEHIPDDRIGIYLLAQDDLLSGPSDIVISDNQVSGGLYAVYSTYGTNVIVSKNTFLDQQRNAIYFAQNRYCQATFNRINNPNGAGYVAHPNGAGIYFATTAFCTALGNVIMDTRLVSTMPYGTAEEFGCVANNLMFNIISGVTTDNHLKGGGFYLASFNGTTGDLGDATNAFQRVFANAQGGANAAFSFAGYPGTGLNLWGANDMSLMAGGSVRMRVNSSGLIPNGPYSLGGPDDPWSASYVQTSIANTSVTTNAVSWRGYFYTLPNSVGTEGKVLMVDTGGAALKWGDAGSASASGADYSLQYNATGGAMGGAANALWNSANQTLTLSGGGALIGPGLTFDASYKLQVAGDSYLRGLLRGTNAIFTKNGLALTLAPTTSGEASLLSWYDSDGVSARESLGFESGSPTRFLLNNNNGGGTLVRDNGGFFYTDGNTTTNLIEFGWAVGGEAGRAPKIILHEPGSSHTTLFTQGYGAGLLWNANVLTVSGGSVGMTMSGNSVDFGSSNVVEFASPVAPLKSIDVKTLRAETNAIQSLSVSNLTTGIPTLLGQSDGTALLTNIVLQSTWTAHDSGSNYVADISIPALQWNMTTNLNLVHATNGTGNFTAGVLMAQTLKIINDSGTNFTVSVPATWKLYGLTNNFWLTNGDYCIGAIQYFGPSTSQTNIDCAFAYKAH